MDTIGLDLHKREIQLCILAEDGTVQERRIVTSRERFTAVLGCRPKARNLIEAKIHVGVPRCSSTRETVPRSTIVFPFQLGSDPPTEAWGAR